MITIRKAKHNDTEDVINFYKMLIEEIKHNDTNPEWKFGVHPKKEDIINAIKSKELSIGLIDSEIVSSIVVNHNATREFDNVKWNVETSYDKVYYIHLLAVSQKHTNCGFAKKMMKYTIKEAKNNSIKSIRLSIIQKNIGIENLYTQFGFKHVTSVDVKEERGLKHFQLYEKTMK